MQQVLSHAGIDAATVEPLLPYFAARYKTQKDGRSRGLAATTSGRFGLRFGSASSED